MGILPSPKIQDKPVASTAKRRSIQTDFANLKPLKAGGALGFSNFRDTGNQSSMVGDVKDKFIKEDSDMDSDEEEEDCSSKGIKQEDTELQDLQSSLLSPEDAKRQGELAEGVQKIRVSLFFSLFLFLPLQRAITTSKSILTISKLKRQHSAEDLDAGSQATRKSPASNSPTAGSTPPQPTAPTPTVLTSASYDVATPKVLEEGIIGSPLKKQRASLSGVDDEAMRKRLGLGLSGVMGDVMARIDQDKEIRTEDDDEL